MNAYFVLSEWLTTWRSSGSLEAPEDYRICEIVVARSPSQARYLAWQTDDGLSGSYPGAIEDMPRFSTRKLAAADDAGEPRVVSDNEDFLHLWEHEKIAKRT